MSKSAYPSKIHKNHIHDLTFSNPTHNGLGESSNPKQTNPSFLNSLSNSSLTSSSDFRTNPSNHDFFHGNKSLNTNNNNYSNHSSSINQFQSSTSIQNKSNLNYSPSKTTALSHDLFTINSDSSRHVKRPIQHSSLSSHPNPSSYVNTGPTVNSNSFNSITHDLFSTNKPSSIKSDQITKDLSITAGSIASIQTRNSSESDDDRRNNSNISKDDNSSSSEEEDDDVSASDYSAGSPIDEAEEEEDMNLDELEVEAEVNDLFEEDEDDYKKRKQRRMPPRKTHTNRNESEEDDEEDDEEMEVKYIESSEEEVKEDEDLEDVEILENPEPNHKKTDPQSRIEYLEDEDGNNLFKVQSSQPNKNRSNTKEEEVIEIGDSENGDPIEENDEIDALFAEGEERSSSREMKQERQQSDTAFDPTTKISSEGINLESATKISNQNINFNQVSFAKPSNNTQSKDVSATNESIKSANMDKTNNISTIVDAKNTNTPTATENVKNVKENTQNQGIIYPDMNINPATTSNINDMANKDIFPQPNTEDANTSKQVKKKKRKKKKKNHGKWNSSSFVSLISTSEKGTTQNGSANESNSKRRKKSKKKLSINVDSYLGLSTTSSTKEITKLPTPTSQQSSPPSHDLGLASKPITSSSNSAHGTICVALPEDYKYLTELHCHVRSNLEFFATTHKDIALAATRRRRGAPLVIGKVGLRCIHCRFASDNLHNAPIVNMPTQQLTKNGTIDKRRGPGGYSSGSISYPPDLAAIYTQCSQKPNLHFLKCPNLPSDIRQKFHEYMFDEFGNPKRQKQASPSLAMSYCKDAARRLGLVDSKDGIQFTRDLSLGPLPICPNLLAGYQAFSALPMNTFSVKKEAVVAPTKSNILTRGVQIKSNPLPINAPDITPSNILSNLQPAIGMNMKTKPKAIPNIVKVFDSLVYYKEDPITTNVIHQLYKSPRNDSVFGPFVFQHHRSLISDYVFFILSQFTICHVDAQDFHGKRSKRLRYGTAGLCCKHCALKPSTNPGRSFPTTPDNIVSGTNVSYLNHALKCFHVSPELKHSIQAAKKNHSAQMSSLPHGSQRMFAQLFFKIIRDHDDITNTAPPPKSAQTSPKVEGGWKVPVSNQKILTPAIHKNPMLNSNLPSTINQQPFKPLSGAPMTQSPTQAPLRPNGLSSLTNAGLAQSSPGPIPSTAPISISNTQAQTFSSNQSNVQSHNTLTKSYITQPTPTSASRTPSFHPPATLEQIQLFGFLKTSSGWYVCKHCRLVPLDLRAKLSLFSIIPSEHQMRTHQTICKKNGFELRPIIQTVQAMIKNIDGMTVEMLGHPLFQSLIRELVGGNSKLCDLFTIGIQSKIQDPNKTLITSGMGAYIPKVINEGAIFQALQAFRNANTGVKKEFVINEDFGKFVGFLAPTLNDPEKLKEFNSRFVKTDQLVMDEDEDTSMFDI